MSNPIEKTCTACGLDVRSLPRTKDQHGRYYCNPCWAAQAQPASPLDELAAVSLAAPTATTSTRAHPAPKKSRVESIPAVFRWAIVGCILAGLLFVNSLLTPVEAKKPSTADTDQESHEAYMARLAKESAENDQRRIAAKRAAGYEITSLPLDIKIVDMVTNERDVSLLCRNWRIEGWAVECDAEWTGDPIDAVTYTIRQSGTVIKRGSVIVAGGGFRKGEPTRASVLFPGTPSSNMELVIEIMH